MPCQIKNPANCDITDMEPHIHGMYDYFDKKLVFQKPPVMVFDSNPSNEANVLGKTAYYDPNSMEIHVFTDGRHPKDMLRSIAHELIHHKQNLDGRLDVGGYMGPGYYLKNKAMKELEDQAMQEGNGLMREYEDHLKIEENKKMSLKEWKNNELNKLLMKKFGILKEEKKKHPLDVAPPFEGKPDAKDFKKLRDDKENVDENLELEEGSCGSHDKDLEESSCMGKKRLNEEEEEEDHEELTRKKESGIPLSPEEEERLKRYESFGDDDNSATRMAEPDEMDYKPRGMNEGEHDKELEEGGRSDRPESATNMQGQKEPQQMRRAASGKQLEEALKRITEASRIFKKFQGRK